MRFAGRNALRRRAGIFWDELDELDGMDVVDSEPQAVHFVHSVHSVHSVQAGARRVFRLTVPPAGR